MSVPAWLRAALLAGLLYLIVGLGTADLARRSGAGWRLAAWAISGVVFLAHLAYERTRLRSAATTAAFHAALAVALGAFGLALAATLRAAATGNFRAGYAVALVAWPAMTGVAAFAGARVIIFGLGLLGGTTHEPQ